MKLLNWLNEPHTLKWIHGGFVIFWLMLWALAAVTGWISSVSFVSHLSIIALVLSSWSAWQASRTEVREKENGKGE